MSDASDTSKALATLARGEELVVIGSDKDGFINVQAATASGWVKIVLVQKR
jgi:TusA-related sulfurtransferase